MERNSGRFLPAVLGITVLLVIPMIVMAPDEAASDNPGGPVYDLEDQYNDNPTTSGSRGLLHLS